MTPKLNSKYRFNSDKIPPPSFFEDFEGPIPHQFAIEMVNKVSCAKLTKRSLIHEAVN